MANGFTTVCDWSGWLSIEINVCEGNSRKKRCIRRNITAYWHTRSASTSIKSQMVKVIIPHLPFPVFITHEAPFTPINMPRWEIRWDGLSSEVISRFNIDAPSWDRLWAVGWRCLLNFRSIPAYRQLLSWFNGPGRLRKARSSDAFLTLLQRHSFQLQSRCSRERGSSAQMNLLEDWMASSDLLFNSPKMKLIAIK
jgi:hypothetical protein